MNDAARITNILLSLRDATDRRDDVDDDRIGHDVSVDDGRRHAGGAFLSALLRGCDRGGGGGGSSATSMMLLSSLFHHWSALPRLERALRSFAMRYAALLPNDARIVDDALGTSFASFCPGFTSSMSTTMSRAMSTTSTGSTVENTTTMTKTVAPSPVGGTGTYAKGDGGIGGGTSDPVSLSNVGGGMVGRNPLGMENTPWGMVLWRDQTPLIGLYHETLSRNMGAILCMDRTLVGHAIGALLHPDIWPIAEGGNTPKVVLLLHEADDLIGLLSTRSGERDDAKSNAEKDDACYLASFDPYLVPLVSRLCACISSENSRLSERALQFFRNETFKLLVRRRVDDVGHLFLRALCRCPCMDVPWNPTVKRMTLLVLQELEGYYSSNIEGDSFRKACEVALSGVDLSRDGRSSEEIVKSAIGTAKAGKAHSETPIISKNMTSIRGAMGSWKPPPQKGRTLSSKVSSSSAPPPATITGVAPWAMVDQGRQKQPPLTVTGVAPWAMANQIARKPLDTLPRPSKKSQSMGGFLPPMLDDGSETQEENIYHKNHENITALDLIRSYMEKLRPKGEGEESTDGVSSWAKAQMDESPVLLTNLKFHDLVFGQELGSGAFSTVKYARHIVKTRTRSSWPEYAVKIVSTQKIDEMGYEQSINREIAILRTLSHPGISRLVSSFRFRDGAYLVLEYASGGDLHTLLRRNGSLDHDSTRFVIGSVAAALSSIHELGFVYADCKPENILITETGHIKITDFGGCRPVTQKAKLMVNESSKNLLRQLRDGDWRPSISPSSDDEITKEQHEDDLRIEGTTAYLPPEVVIGGYPTTAADIWALGCVLFQCISGRPPILEDNDHLTVQKIVTFNLASDEQNFFGEWNASGFRNDAKALIRRMLHHDASCRPNVMQIAEAEFFEGVDIFTLHKRPAHPLNVGSIAPDSDAKWSRRQFRYVMCINLLTFADLLLRHLIAFII
ncbi:hypothetical protein ACHAXA_003233 [Cyclostephanos tholiformis]|uniref:non-specific serine/threonine protein kinase n=1 Tax=Cyclostephanos tholiformis TaxID=382380 RepID=A0ABD3RLA4_9STRA